MVKMRKALRETGLRESTELPDHLCHVLPLLDRLDHVDAAGLAKACVLPALGKMIAGFADRNNPFECVLKTIRCVLQDRYPVTSGGNSNG
jgi:nitrate reductase assembly molybdenum cofactor insertion protein NarJ